MTHLIAADPERLEAEYEQIGVVEAYAGLKLRPLAWPPVKMELEPRLWVLRLKGAGGGDRDGQ